MTAHTDSQPTVAVVRDRIPAALAARLAVADDAMIYSDPAFHAFLAEAVGGEFLAFVAHRDGQAIAALCALEKTVPHAGTVINSLPWYGSHGGCVGVALDDSTRRALLDALAAYVGASRPLSATVICTPQETAHAAIYRDILEPVAEDARIGQFTALPASSTDFERDLDGVLKQKTRNLARKARRQGFVEQVADTDEAWRELHAIHTRNMDAIGGMAKPWSHFEALRRHIPAHARRLSLALDGETVTAGLLVLVHHRTVEYLVPVIASEHRSRQPLSFLIWHAMQWAVERGCTRWNWGGTWGAQDSLHHFKAGWGAADHPYRYFTLATMQGVDWIRDHRSELSTLFPFYYVYPFAAL